MEKSKDRQTFGNLLNHRFHSIISHLEDISAYITIFVQLIEEDENKKLRLTYQGLDSQREYLTNNLVETSFDERYLLAWEELKEHYISVDSPNDETFYLLDEYRNGTLALDNIYPNSLKEYFWAIRTGIQKNEHEILSKYFDIELSCYVLLPLIFFGEFNGLISIVFSQNDLIFFSNQKNIARIIKNFSLEYEKLAINWKIDVLPNNHKNYEALLDSLQSQSYYEKINTNPLLKSLRLLEYYQNSDEYYRNALRERINFSELDEGNSTKNEDLKLSTFWEMPAVLKSAFHQFLIYFSKYVNDFYNVSIDFTIVSRENGLELLLGSSTYEHVENIDRLLFRYLSYIFDESYKRLEANNKYPDELKGLIYLKKIDELRFENEMLKKKINTQLEMIAMVNSLSGSILEDASLRVNAHSFTGLASSEIKFSKSLNDLVLESKKISNYFDNNQDFTVEIKNQIKRLLEKGEVITTLDILANHFEESNNHISKNIISLHKINYMNYKNEKNSGLISYEDFNVQINRIVMSILELIYT